MSLYIGAILPVATYGLAIFWKSKKGNVLNQLNSMQNKCLHMIMGAIHTTNISAMEIEASIPPINLWMEFKLNMEALHIARLANDHPIVCQLYPEQREDTTPLYPPPLPTYNNSKRHCRNPKIKFTTCITRISKRILEHTEHTKPHPKPPWRITEINIPENIQIFLPTNTPGQSSKEEWTNNHIKFMTEIEDDDQYLIIYSDSSLMDKSGRMSEYNPAY